MLILMHANETEIFGARFKIKRRWKDKVVVELNNHACPEILLTGASATLKSASFLLTDHKQNIQPYASFPPELWGIRTEIVILPWHQKFPKLRRKSK